MKEVHILKEYPADFYGSTIQVAIVGYIRGMVKFDGIGTNYIPLKNFETRMSVHDRRNSETVQLLADFASCGLRTTPNQFFVILS